MRKNLCILITFLILCSSCKKESDQNQNLNSLEGTWLLQNIQSGARLTFSGNLFTIASGSVILKGTYNTSGNTLQGNVTSRSGANSGALTPDAFNGNFSISGDVVTFTNFNGNWNAIFSTWYKKQ